MRGMYFITSNGGSRGTKPNNPNVFKVLPNRTIVDVTESSRDFFNTKRRGRSAIAISLRLNKESRWAVRQQQGQKKDDGERRDRHRIEQWMQQTRQQQQNRKGSGRRKKGGGGGQNKDSRTTKSVSNWPQPDVLLLNRADDTRRHHRAFEIDRFGTLHERILSNSHAFMSDVNKYGGVTDLDNDGVMEVILTGRLHIYRLIADFKLKDITPYVLPDTDLTATLGFAELDYDNDGRFDLFLVRSIGGVHRFFRHTAKIHDQLLRNADGRFYVDATKEANILPLLNPGRSHGVTVGDFDNDGNIDILVVRFRATPSFSIASLLSLFGRGDGAKPTANDRRKANKANKEPYIFLMNNGDGTFRKLIHYGFSRRQFVDGDTATAVDYDGDGRLDLVVSEGNWGMNDRRRGYYRILRNVWRTGNGYLLVRVKNAPKLRRTSLHALVTVTLMDGSVRVRRVGSPGTLVSNSYVETVHFGVGLERRVRKVEVKWTDGTKLARYRVGVNRTLTFGV